MTNFKAEAGAALSEFFSEELAAHNYSLRDFEEFVRKEGTKILCSAMENALKIWTANCFPSVALMFV